MLDPSLTDSLWAFSHWVRVSRSVTCTISPVAFLRRFLPPCSCDSGGAWLSKKPLMLTAFELDAMLILLHLLVEPFPQRVDFFRTPPPWLKLGDSRAGRERARECPPMPHVDRRDREAVLGEQSLRLL